MWDSKDHNTIGEAFVDASATAAPSQQVTRIGEELIASSIARLRAMNAANATHNKER